MNNTNSQKSTLLMRSCAGFLPSPTPANKWEREGRAWYNRDPRGFTELRNEQHATLVEHFKAISNTIELDAIHENPDLVFTADGSISLAAEGQTTTILSSFLNPNRQGEEQYYTDYFNAQTKRTLIQSPYAFEGNGDCLYDPFRDCFWSGYHANPDPKTAHEGRGDIRANTWLAQQMSIPAHNLENNAPYYHIDTALSPLPRGHIVVFEGGLTQQGYNHLGNTAIKKFNLNPDEYLIKISAEDANKFACNIRCIGNTLVMPECSIALQDQLKYAGYEVITTPVTAFIAGGGAVHCLTNAIDEQRIIGGYFRQNHLMPKTASALVL